MLEEREYSGEPEFLKLPRNPPPDNPYPTVPQPHALVCSTCTVVGVGVSLTAVLRLLDNTHRARILAGFILPSAENINHHS